MMIPVRCYTCGRPLAQYYSEFKKRVESGEDPAKVLDELGITRYCCRKTMLASVDVSREVIKFSKHVHRW